MKAVTRALTSLAKQSRDQWELTQVCIARDQSLRAHTAQTRAMLLSQGKVSPTLVAPWSACLLSAQDAMPEGLQDLGELLIV